MGSQLTKIVTFTKYATAKLDLVCLFAIKHFFYGAVLNTRDINIYTDMHLNKIVVVIAHIWGI
jgi:hypothetical protein